MGRDDLLKMLGLTGDDAAPTKAPAGADPLAAPAPGSVAPAATNRNAMDCDEWTERRGQDLADESGGDPVDLADLHAACFDPEPTLLPDCADRTKRGFLEQLMDTPEYRALRTSTMLNEAASAVASAKLGERLADLKRDEATKMGATDPRPGKARGKADAEAAALREGMKAMRAVAEGLAEAVAEVELLEQSETACGMGKCAAGGAHDPTRTARLFQRVRRSATLARIMELAGKFRLVARSRQRRKVIHGMDDLVGVTLDGEVGRLIPAELARLVLPETELDTLRRIVERQAMCRDHHATEPVGKGPILVSVDESGSMTGDKVCMAKALALALAWVARQQNRWCGLVAFSGNTGHRLLALPPTGWDESRVLDWLEKFEGGGSDLDVPVREMPDFYRRLGAPAGITDVVMITDAICHLNLGDRERFNAWKASVKARVIGLIIGNEPGDLDAVCDESHSVPCLDPGGEEVGRVLAL